MTRRQIEQMALDVEVATRNYLRDNGWTYTCQTPGNLWLWSKTLDHGRVFLCGERTALAIQQALTPEPETEDVEC